MDVLTKLGETTRRLISIATACGLGPRARARARRALLRLAAIAALLPAFMFAGRPAPAAADTGPAPIVLVLYGSYTGFSPHDRFHDRLVEAVNKVARRYVEVRAEFFDASGEQSDEFDALVIDYLQRKYPRDRVAVVVGVGARPIYLAKKVRSVLFPSAGLVYGLADRKRMAGFDYGPDATGVTGDVDITGTVSLALQLVPDTAHVAVVLGPTEPERAWYERVVADCEAAAPGVDLIKLVGLPKDEMLQRLATLPDHTVVVWVSFFRGPGDDLSVPADVLAEALDASNAPIFGVLDGDFGRGIVGGRIVDLGRHGEETGRLAARIVNGERAGTIPPVHVADNPATIDWRALRRWSIDPGRLPRDAAVFYRELTVWDQYGWYLVGALAVFAAQGAIIAALFVEQRRRRRAATALRASEQRSMAILRAAPDIMFLLSADGVYLDYYAKSVDQLFIPPEQFLGRNQRDVLPRELAEKFASALRAALASGEPETVEYELDLSGRERCFEARIVATGDGTLLSVVRDVTEQRASDEARKRLTDRLLRLQDEERKRVAAELHDGLGQSLSIIRNRATIGLRDVSDTDRVAEQLREISNSAGAAIDEVREIAHNLRPFELDRLGLAEAVRSMAGRVSDSAGIRIVVDVDLSEAMLSPEDEMSVYRIVQEALNNVVRHAAASEARVSIGRAGPALVVAVSDDGRGIGTSGDRAGSANGDGFGLADIAERARMLGGSFAIGSPSGRGTTVRVTIPVPTDRANWPSSGSQAIEDRT